MKDESDFLKKGTFARGFFLGAGPNLVMWAAIAFVVYVVFWRA